MFKRVAFSAIVLSALVLAAAQQQDLGKVEIEVERAGDHVYMLKGAGGNIAASVGDDGILIVDSEFEPLVPKISDALKNIADEPVRFLINTHFHGDHTGGNARFAEMSAEIIAQENARKRLASGGSSKFGKSPPAAKEALPIITFGDNLSVYFNGEEVRAIHIPSGHTDGDCVIIFTQSKVVHMGDDFFNGSFPFIDVDSGGSITGLIAGIEKVLAEIPDDARIIPGHGSLATKDDVRNYLAMLKGSSAAISAAIAAGKTLDQIKQSRPLAPWDAWGKSFIDASTFTEVLYTSLTR